jgi:hypothetical protein
MTETITLEQVMERVNAIERTHSDNEKRSFKKLMKSIRDIDNTFKPNLPKWLVDKQFEFYENEKNYSLRNLHKGEIW